VKFTIPALPPTINHYYGRNGNHLFMRPEGTKFRQIVNMTLAQFRHRIVKDDRLAVSIGLVFANRRRCDIDNRLKALLDSLMHAGVLVDDSAIDRLHVQRFAGDEEKTVVRITKI